jgi:hypothetical protein
MDKDKVLTSPLNNIRQREVCVWISCLSLYVGLSNCYIVYVLKFI